MIVLIRCTPSVVDFVCEGLDHPEGLCFGADGSIIAGGEAGQIYRIDPDSRKADTIGNSGGFILGVSSDSKGNVYACDCKRNEVLKLDSSGTVSGYSKATADPPNYCAFDRQGNLFFTTSGEYFHPEGTGKLFAVTPEGETRCVHPGPFRFANGICIDPEENLLYLIQSTAPNILVFEIRGAELTRLEPIRTIALEKDTVPDGLALDTARNLYVAFYTPDQIGVVRPGGDYETLYRDCTGELLMRPTNIALQHDAIYFANLGGYHIGRIEHPLEPLEVVRP